MSSAYPEIPFADIKLHSLSNLESRTKTFLDPVSSSACHARTLEICCGAVDSEEVSQTIQRFSRAERLTVDCIRMKSNPPESSLIPFRYLSSHPFSPPSRGPVHDQLQYANH